MNIVTVEEHVGVQELRKKLQTAPAGRFTHEKSTVPEPAINVAVAVDSTLPP